MEKSQLSHLTPAQVHSALACYFDNQDEIDAEILENSDEEKWKTQVETHPRLRTIQMTLTKERG